MAVQQTKLTSFLSKGTALALSTSSGMASAEAREARRAEAAQSLGLTWPPPLEKPEVGRPPKLKLYVNMVYQTIRRDQFEGIAHLTSAAPPKGWDGKSLAPAKAALTAAHHILDAWHEVEQEQEAVVAGRPGSSTDHLQRGREDLQPEVEEQQDLAAATVAAPAVPQEEPTQEEPPAEEPLAGEPPAEGPKRKRRKTHVPRGAQTWFLTWAQYMKKEYGTSFRASWQNAVAMCPELFANINPNSFSRHWFQKLACKKSLSPSILWWWRAFP